MNNKQGLVFMPYIIESSTEGKHEDFISRKEAAGFISSDMWNKMHKLCPICKNNKIIHSLVGIIEHFDKDYVDDINTANCTECDWSGKVNELTF